MTGEVFLLKGDESSNLRYRIEGGMDERDAREYESNDSSYTAGIGYWKEKTFAKVDMRHRMRYLRKKNLGLSFVGFENLDFKERLEKISPKLPDIVAWMIRDGYYDGTTYLHDIVDSLEYSNPLRESDTKIYGDLVRKMLFSFLPDDQSLDFRTAYGKNLSFEDDASFTEYLFKHSFLSRVEAGKFGCGDLKKKGKTYEIVLTLSIGVL